MNDLQIKKLRSALKQEKNKNNTMKKDLLTTKLKVKSQEQKYNAERDEFKETI